MSATLLKHTALPWKVVPDQPSHGACLCIESDTTVIARTPDTKKYGCKEQVTIDEPNAAFIVKACNFHERIVDMLWTCIDAIDNAHDDPETCVKAVRLSRALLLELGEVQP